MPRGADPVHQSAWHRDAQERRGRSPGGGRNVSAATRASSTKGWTGHALGAAGSLEAIITLLALDTGLIPGTLNTTQLDPQVGPQIQLENCAGEVRYALSNSFGFGGSNCVLLFGREAT